MPRPGGTPIRSRPKGPAIGTEQWTDQRAPLPPPQPEDRASDALVVVSYLTAFFLPIMGFILGIVLMVRRRTGHGLAVVLVAIVAGFVVWRLALNDAEARVHADEHLERIAVGPSGWEVSYRCPTTGEGWLEDYPRGEEHGGGPIATSPNYAPPH